jgi:PAS domain-containing protein
MPKRDQSVAPARAKHLALMHEVERLRRSERLLREENEELVEGQALLEEARDDFAELYDWAPLPLLSLGALGTIRSANLATAELLERERSSLVGHAFPPLFHELDQPTLTLWLSTNASTKPCTAQIVLPHQGLLEVTISKHLSRRKIGVSHISLLDSRVSLVAAQLPQRQRG